MSLLMPYDEPLLKITGNRNACGIKASDRTGFCWGVGGEPATVPEYLETTPLTDISPGCYHTCALPEDGVPVCWGRNEFGQLDVPAGENFKAVSAGCYHSLALTRKSGPDRVII